MKKFRVEIFRDIESFNTVVEAETKFEAIQKTMENFKAKEDPREYWPMRAFEL